MAASDNGAVSFEAGGATRVLRFSINALIELEAKLGYGIAEIGAKMGSAPSIAFLRTVFWGGLIHADPELTEAAAGELMDELGLTRSGELIGQAFTAAFPEAKGAASGEPRPRKRAGAGASS